MTAVAVWIDGAPAFSLVFEAVDGPGRPRVVGCVESRHTYDDVLLLRGLVLRLPAK